MKRHKRGKPLKVSITQHVGAQPLLLLEKVLEAAGFWKQVAQVHRALGRPKDQFRILIKPDLDFYDALTPGGTDPALVEHMIDLLHERGFRNVALGDGRNEPDAWLHNREPLVVPDLVGYRFATAKGRAYEFVDLQGELSESDRSARGSSTPISKYWTEASYRINFAKNKTHEDCVFALCVHNLAGLAGAKDANGAPRRRIAPEDCLEILRRAPPHFNIIDAFTSCHGGAGHRAPQPMETHAFIASADALLADWAGAAKMGVDPYASPVNSVSLRNIGLPAHYEIDGDLAPYPLWRNVHPLIAHSARLRNRSDGLGQIAAAWFQSVDRERFPLKDFYNDRINSFVSPLMAGLDENPRSFWAVVFINYAIARIDSAILAQYTMFSKNKLRRQAAPLTLDLAAYDRTDYEAIPDYLARYEQLLENFPANRMGLRWRHVDGSILFSCSHALPIPYERFVGAVDITRAIQYMNDYIGGATVAVRRDGRQRVVHQAERNLYLQQPNWMVFFGGELIDVEKLEFINYKKDSQTISWRTVVSPNDSARHDDGSVSFARTGAGQTTVRIFARQQFALPLFFHLFDVNLAPGIRDPIIDSAYTTFFAGTIANLQAAYEGREFRIGQDAGDAGIPEQAGMRELPRYLATAAAAVAELLRHRGDAVELGQWLFGANIGPVATSGRKETDRHGFRHFGPTPSGTRYVGRGDEQAVVAGMAALIRDAPDFLTGFADAVHKDLDRMANPDPEASGK
ncbi:MAG TPA: DUF362 domain-containing protein [Casimicrobiaceae bacterium]|nr:DUF362 domain-containing protein [Casimicrobiaceae bacterium]